MTSHYPSKIIIQLKQHQSTNLNITELLYLLNHLISQKPYPLEYVHKFIRQNYSHQEIVWKTMDQEMIESMHQEQLEYIQQHERHWKTEAQRQQTIQSEYLDEKKRIKKILKEKSFTKEQLIDTYLEEIRRNKTILAKSVLQKSKDFKESKESSELAEKLKYQQNIELLQKRINIMRDSAKFDTENDEKLLEKHGIVNSKNATKQKELNRLVQEFQFKKKYFQDLQKNTQLEEAFQKKKKLLSKSKSLNHRLKQLFLKYSSQNYDPSVSFQKNNQKLIHIDLRLFLKYFKELKEAFSGDYFINDENNSKIFKANNLTVVFKKYSKNHREINFIQFLDINYELFLEKQNAYGNGSETQILGEEKEIQKIKILSHESLQYLDEELEKLEEIKDIFFNEKVNKIINVNEKFEETENSSQMTQRSTQKTSNSDNVLNENKRIKESKIGKIIDKTLQDYEKTRNQIHETFMRRHRKQTLQNLDQRLNANSNEHNSNIKIIVNKEERNGLQKSHKKLGRNDAKSSHSRNMTDMDINTFSHRNIFNQIIREVEEQNEEENEGFGKIVRMKSKSYANLLSARDMSKVTDPKNRGSSLSTRNSSSNMTTSSLKSIFTLPKITRLSQERLQKQSITKTLSYLYNVLGKQEEPRIKKILELDNSHAIKSNKIENQYLNEYFDKEGNQESQKKKSIEEFLRHKKQQFISKPSCKKFKKQNYQKFMKFS